MASVLDLNTASGTHTQGSSIAWGENARMITHYSEFANEVNMMQMGAKGVLFSRI